MENKIEIYSEIKNLFIVEDFIRRIYQKEDLNRKMFCRIYISVSEAVNNAIFHGNKKDKNKSVRILFYKEDEFLIFSITDQGNGFDYNHIPDPTSKENIFKESGRGIFLMKKYCDNLIFENGGNTVKLLFKLS